MIPLQQKWSEVLLRRPAKVETGKLFSHITQRQVCICAYAMIKEDRHGNIYQEKEKISEFKTNYHYAATETEAN
jgi:hypothetical protein